MHCFLACASQRKQLVGAPSISTHGDITWWFWDPGIGVLANLKAVLMCIMTFTKSSSGLSGCQCCMICIEHVLHSPMEGHGCFKCVQTVLLALVLCLYVKSQRLLGDLLQPSMDSCHSKGMMFCFFFSNAHKHPVITVALFTLSFLRKLPGFAAWTAAALFLYIISPSLILTRLSPSEYTLISVKTHKWLFFLYPIWQYLRFACFLS